MKAGRNFLKEFEMAKGEGGKEKKLMLFSCRGKSPLFLTQQNECDASIARSLSGSFCGRHFDYLH